MKLRTFRLQVVRMAAPAILLLLVAGYGRLGVAQESAPKTFASPAHACNALFQAVHSEDEQTLESLLGAGKEVTSSNDEVEDKLEREGFCRKYQEMHRLVQEPDGNTVLYIGMENWPFPVPLVSKNGKWYFDSKAGKQEILFRRIGANEATAIEVCHTLATARKQPGTKATGDDQISQFVEGLVTAGTSNAGSNARAATDQDLNPYYGYRFRTVTEQPENAAAARTNTSGSKKVSQDVAFVAFPARYRSTGVMTFVVTQDGVVHERDLGPKTATLAPTIKKCSPASTWHVVK